MTHIKQGVAPPVLGVLRVALHFAAAALAAGLVLSGCSSGSQPAAVTQITSPAPTVSLSADPTTVATGTAATLTWSSTNATACTASGGWDGAESTSGSASTGALSVATSYTLTCSGASGSTPAKATATVTVTPPLAPTVTLSANPTTVATGTAATLTWSSTNATACTASGGWSGAKATSGNVSTGALSVTTSYTLTCSGASGSTPAMATATVSVTPPAPTVTPPAPTVTLSANPTIIGTGTAATLTWSSTNATSCTASGGWGGAESTSGSIPTGALTATTSYTLTCSGAGGSKSATATVTVTSSNVVTVTPQFAALTSSQNQQFTATVPGGAAAIWSVDGLAKGNATVGTITAGGLYSPGSAVGTHTIGAVSAANSSQSGVATVAVTDLAGVFTRHVDGARTGQNLKEYALTPAVVGGTGNFGKLFQCSLDGSAYAQPLYVANLSIAGGVHNVVFVATENDSVYAFDADTVPCVTYWHVSFVNGTTVTPVAASIPYMSTSLLNWDILNEIGITGTPVINVSAGTIYLVAKTQETDQGGNITYHDRLHELTLSTGSEPLNSPVDITATVSTNGGQLSFTPITQNQRPGLLLSSYANGTAVYIAWSSYGDLGVYHGWVMAYDATTLAQVAVWSDTPNGTEGGIWMANGGIAVDSGGALYLSTGNGTFDDTADLVPPVAPNNDFGESFVKLDPSALTVTDYYTPSLNAAWTAHDEDLASSGVTVLPDGLGPTGHPNTLVGSDKQGHLWLIDRDQMSRFSPTSDNTVQYLTLPNIAGCSENCTYSTPAYYDGNIYVGMTSASLMAYTLSGGLFSASNGIATPSSVSTEVYQYPGPTPAISASPAGNGIVWVLDNYANGTDSDSVPTTLGPAILRAYDARNLTTLYSSSSLASDTAGNAVKFTEPTIANGKVYVGGAGTLTVYGVLQ